MNEEFLKQVIAELQAKQAADIEQIETGLGTSLVILALSLSDQIDKLKLIKSIESRAAFAQKHGYLNATTNKLLTALANALEDELKAYPHEGQAKH